MADDEVIAMTCISKFSEMEQKLMVSHKKWSNERSQVFITDLKLAKNKKAYRSIGNALDWAYHQTRIENINI